MNNWVGPGLILAAWLASGYGLLQAWRAVARTSLHHARWWWLLAWVGWGLAFIPGYPDWARPLTYVALVLTAAAGVAILGAKEPGLRAWNLVVVGLIATLSLPLIEQRWNAGTWRLDSTWAVFLGTLLAALAFNHLFTCWTWSMLAALLACGGKLFWLWLPADRGDLGTSWGLSCSLALVLAMVVAPVWPLARLAVTDPLNQPWRRFRDYFGMVWSLRARDQFNAAAANAGIGARLEWRGLRGVETSETDRVKDLLDKVLRPFSRSA